MYAHWLRNKCGIGHYTLKPYFNHTVGAIGRDPGDAEKDAEGIQTMKALGQNMAWLMKKICD